MGARGPLKLANHLSVVPVDAAGSVAADVQVSLPPKPTAVASNKALSELWDEIVPELDRAGMIAAIDGPAIEMCLRHFRAARAASDDLLGASSTVWDAKNAREMKNPAEVVFRSESMAFLEYARQLGMTFVARARTPGVKGDGDGETNPFAATGT